MDEQILRVNSEDEVLGTIGKVEAHQGKGTLHRAFTIFLRNSEGLWLITQRSTKKPLWPLWWDGACSSHQWLNEDDISASQRRIPFELGVEAQNLEYSFKYEYHAVYSQEWAENEVNHIVLGTLNEDPQLNPDEVAAFAWKSTEQIDQELQDPDHRYAPWFPLAWQKLRTV